MHPPLAMVAGPLIHRSHTASHSATRITSDIQAASNWLPPIWCTVQPHRSQCAGRSHRHRYYYYHTIGRITASQHKNSSVTIKLFIGEEAGKIIEKCEVLLALTLQTT